jgi:hypothetical protein
LDSLADFSAAWRPESLIYFVLNVGDGDSQVLILPENEDGNRSVIVVDIYTVDKMINLFESLMTAGILGKHSVELVVATHPHTDHIGGISQFLREYVRPHLGIPEGEDPDPDVRYPTIDFWEPGYYHTTGDFIDMMGAVEDLRSEGLLRPSQPTAGFTSFYGNVKFTVLTPGIALRSRYDSYGVNINNASLSLKVEFPASRVFLDRNQERQYVKRPTTSKIILGADTQTLGWSQALVDFPTLEPTFSPVAAEMKKQMGNYPLSADVFKISHHASKNGINLELVDLIGPSISIISSAADSRRHGFPHDVSMNLIREAVHPVAKKGGAHPADHELGIHHTSASDDGGNELGSIAIVMHSPRSREIWRFGDNRGDDIVLGNASLFSP